MSGCGAVVRDEASVREEKARARELWKRAARELCAASTRDLPGSFKALDLALTHAVYFGRSANISSGAGKSRGSYLVPDASGRPPHPLLGGRWAFSLAGPGDFVSANVLEVRLDGQGHVQKKWIPVRPMPRPEGWFESRLGRSSQRPDRRRGGMSMPAKQQRCARDRGHRHRPRRRPGDRPSPPGP